MQQTICKRCVMDTTDLDITFDEKGYCNHCTGYYKLIKQYVFKGKIGTKKFAGIVKTIKESKGNKLYDCVIGVSGGVDSTYIAYLMRKLGLSPLLVHVSNGFDTELAIQNIENMVIKGGFNIMYVDIAPDEYKELLLAYLRASVYDIEVPIDHALRAGLFKIAKKYKIKWIIGGDNLETEAILPKAWRYRKNDLRNIKDIYSKFGKGKFKDLKTFPTMSLYQMLWNIFYRGIKIIYPLNYLDYNKEEAKKIIAKEYDWQDYGQKHHECISTRFNQAYILPTKFNIDKRKAHLSTLICAGRITREQALKELAKTPYKSKEMFEQDKKLFLEKVGLSEIGFEVIMNMSPRKHEEFKTDKLSRDFYFRVRNIVHWMRR